MDNPYRPGTAKYIILNGDWSGMKTREIAKQTGYSLKTVQSAISEIKKETWRRVNFVDGRKRKRIKRGNGNIYKVGSKIWKLYDGDWDGKTTQEIAQEIGISRKMVINYISQIAKETGKYVEYLDGRKGRSGRRKKMQVSVDTLEKL